MFSTSHGITKIISISKTTVNVILKFNLHYQERNTEFQFKYTSKKKETETFFYLFNFSVSINVTICNKQSYLSLGM